MRQLVLDYYVALDSALRDQPPRIRRLLAWCRHCGIPFITDPCNAGREDLGCPFGCADLHRRRDSNKRSVDFNRSPEGKLKRYRREEERRRAEERSAAEASQDPGVRSAGPVEEAQDTVSESVEPVPRDQETGSPRTSPQVSPPATDQAASRAEAVAGDPVPCSSEDCGRPSSHQGSPSAGPRPVEPEQPPYAPGILAYVELVISLLEERPVRRQEIVEMLARAKRQRSFAREKRIDYVLRRLREEPEKPP